MNNKNHDKRQYIDIPFILRTFKVWILAIFCVSIVIGVEAAIITDRFESKVYTASAKVAVVCKKNSIYLLLDENVDNAVTRSIDMWSSNVLMKTIQEADPEHPVSGSLSASRVGETNLITVTAYSVNAKDAYYILKMALKKYITVADNFDDYYMSRVLTRPSQSCMSVSYRNPWKFLILGFFGTFFSLIFGLIFWSLRTRRIHCEDQIEDQLDTSLYTSLPYVKKKGNPSISLDSERISADYREGIERLSVRVNNHMNHNNQKMMLVTSAGENEGKTTVAMNLAHSLAARGNKVLLVDFDFRKPALCKILKENKIVNQYTGEDIDLSKALEQESDLVELIRSSEEADFPDCLFQFHTVENGDYLLEKKWTALQFVKLRSLYDIIIADAEPMWVTRDARVAAGICDCSLLVIRQDEDRYTVENDCIDVLEESGASVLGAVFNCCKQKRLIRHRYEYYHSYYANQYRS